MTSTNSTSWVGNNDNSSSVTRALQEQCGTFERLNTTYNDENAIPPYLGVMFELFSKIDMEILTLEIDIRFENGVEDLWIEVYTKEGPFGAYVGDESAWTKVAESEMVRAPEGVGAIIPVEDFTPVPMPRRTKRSFYITMKEAYIDFTAYALQKTGEIYIKGGDFDVLVGSGLTEYKFPAEVDRILDPQFAGVVHYKRVSTSCEELTSEATVEYRFLFSQDMESSFYQTMNASFEGFVSQMLETNPNLISWVEQYGLTNTGIETMSVPFSGQCPPVWTVCPTTYITTKLTFEHGDSLNDGLVRFELLSATDSAIGFANAAGQGVQAVYLGEKSVSVDFSFTLTGTPAVSMDEIQRNYFGEVCLSFAKSTASERYSAVLGVIIDEQINQRRRSLRANRRTNNSGSLSVTGKIVGSLPAAFEPNHFKETLDIAFSGRSEAFVDSLHLGGLRPSKITEDNRIEYFLSINAVTAEFMDVLQPVTSDTGGNSEGLSNASIAMIEGAVFFVLLVGAAVGFHIYRKGNHDRMKAEERRKQRRNNKKNRKETTDSDETVSLLSKVDGAKQQGNKLGSQKNDKSKRAMNPLKEGKKLPSTTNEKRVGLAKSKSVSALGANPSPGITPKKLAPTNAAAKPKPPPTLKKSHSVSVLGATGSSSIAKPQAPNKTGAKVAKVAVAKSGAPRPRPTIQRSLSVSAIGTKNNPPQRTLAVSKPGPSLPTKTDGPGKPKPAIKRSLSVSALGKNTQPSQKTGTLAKPAQGARPAVQRSLSVTSKPQVNKASVKASPSTAGAAKATVARPTLGRSASLSAMKAKTISEPNNKKPTIIPKAATHSTKANQTGASSRPQIARSLSVSAIKGKTAPAAQATKPTASAKTQVVATLPGKGTAVAAPKPRPQLARSQSVSAIKVKTTPVVKAVIKGPGSKPPIASSAQGSADAKPTPKIRPQVSRSMSVSAIKANTTATGPVVKKNAATKPPIATPANGKKHVAPKPRPQLARSLSVSAIKTTSSLPVGKQTSVAKTSAVAPTTKSNEQTVKSTPSATSAVLGKGSEQAVPASKPRPQLARSLSISVMQTKAPTASQPNKAAGVQSQVKAEVVTPGKQAPKEQVSKVDAKSVGAGPRVVKRTMSASEIASGDVTSKTAPPNQPATQKETTIAANKPAPAITRPTIKRSLSVAAIQNKATKPLASAPAEPSKPPKTGTAAEKGAHTGTALSAKPSVKARPQLQRSLSVKAQGTVAQNPSKAPVLAPSQKMPMSASGNTKAPPSRGMLKRSASGSATPASTTKSTPSGSSSIAAKGAPPKPRPTLQKSASISVLKTG